MARRILKKERKKARDPERLAYLVSMEKLWQKRYRKLMENQGRDKGFRMNHV
jgi:hypothetical protein